MKCPKCKQEMKMVEVVAGFSMAVGGIISKERLVCINEECEYYGIPRLELKDKKWGKE